MRTILTDSEVDCLHSPWHHADGKRIRMRREWGRRAGLAAFARGDERNPFWDRPCMPMYDGWRDGYADARVFRDAAATAPVAPMVPEK